MTHAHPKKFTHLWLASLLAAGVTLASTTAAASIYDVNWAGDSHDAAPGNNVCRDSAGRCTLRAAIEEANAHAGWDAINVPVNTYNLTLGHLHVTGDLDIYGSTPGTVVIDAGLASRIFLVGVPGGNPVYLYLYELKLDRGKTFGGGAIKVEDWNDTAIGDHIVISNSVTTGNMGGGVLNQGTFYCYDCEIRNNSTPVDTGGGTQNAGGGLFNTAGASAYLYYSTFAENASTRGGGLAGGGYLEMQNCTVSTNTVRAGGGGFATTSSDAIWGVAYSTITLNRANTGLANEPALGGGFFHRAGSLEIGKTIIAGNIDNRALGTSNSSPDCAVEAAAFTVLSHWDNLWGNVGNHCRVRSVLGGSITGKDRWGSGTSSLPVALGPLQTNGGRTRNHMPEEGSYPIDEVSSGNPVGWWLMECPWRDQIGTDRPQRNACDTGSVEKL
jgi:hypothetical protein